MKRDIRALLPPLHLLPLPATGRFKLRYNFNAHIDRIICRSMRHLHVEFYRSRIPGHNFHRDIYFANWFGGNKLRTHLAA